jgi:hypothetical protein
MESSEQKPVLRYDNVVISADGMTEAHGRKMIIFVPAADIERVTLKFGRPEHNPFVSLTIGIIMVLVGIAGLALFFIGHKANRYYLGLVAFGFIGGSLIFDTLKQRYFLEVQTKKGSRRLVFSKDAQRSDIEDLCAKARAAYSYQIDAAVQNAS